MSTVYHRAVMTKLLATEVWTYFRDFPSVALKEELPIELFVKVESLISYCPLCDFFFSLAKKEVKAKAKCDQCPLDFCQRGTPYNKWKHAQNDRERKEAAEGVLKQIEDWDIKEYLVKEESL